MYWEGPLPTSRRSEASVIFVWKTLASAWTGAAIFPSSSLSRSSSFESDSIILQPKHTRPHPRMVKMPTTYGKRGRKYTLREDNVNIYLIVKCLIMIPGAAQEKLRVRQYHAPRNHRRMRHKDSSKTTARRLIR